jgi:hypothetical protein
MRLGRERYTLQNLDLMVYPYQPHEKELGLGQMPARAAERAR